jgi:hypothetical protein
MHICSLYRLREMNVSQILHRLRVYFFSHTMHTASRSAHELGFIGAWTKRAVANHMKEKGESNAWEFGKCVLHSTFSSLLVYLTMASLWAFFVSLKPVTILNNSQSTDSVRAYTLRGKISSLSTAEFQLGLSMSLSCQLNNTLTKVLYTSPCRI